MMEVIKNLLNVWYKNGDKRAENWILVSNPYFVLVIVTIYAITAKVILPKIWERKKRLEHKNVLGIYFIIHSVISAFFFLVQIYYMIVLFKDPKFNFKCAPVIQSFSGLHYEIAVFGYLWLWFKISEMAETVLTIFVFGEVPIFVFVHHILFPIILTYIVHFYLGGSPFIYGLVNNIDHMIVFFVLGLRLISDKIRDQTENFFRPFHFAVSMVTLSFTIIFYLQLEPRDDCNYETFKYLTSASLSLFLILVAFMRRHYVCPTKAQSTLPVG